MNKFFKQNEGKTDKPLRRRRRMEKFKIDEISAVDRPAQSSALALIMKRGTSEHGVNKRIVLTSAYEGHAHAVSINGDAREVGGGMTMPAEGHVHPFMIDDDGNVIIGETEGHTHEVNINTRNIMIKNDDGMEKQFTAEQRQQLARSGAAMSDGLFPVRNAADLRNAIQAFGRAGNQAAVARHIARRARALGLERLLPTSGDLASMIGKNAADNGGGPELEEKTMTHATEAADKAVEAQVTELEKQLAKAKSFGELTDVQKTYYATLDEAGQTAFLAKSLEDRQAEIDALQKADAVVYKATDGSEYRKSDDPRLVAMAKRADEQHEALRKAEEQRKDMELRKRAEDELPNLPGTVDTHVAILKAIETIKDETVRKAAFDVLKANNAKMFKAFTTVGTTEISKAAAGDAQAELDELAKSHAKEHNVDYYTAYDAVCKAQPDLYVKAMNS